jgi:hypothetical protein
MLAVLPQAGHNDLFERGAWAKVYEFLESLRPESERPKRAAWAGLQMETVAPASVEDR